MNSHSDHTLHFEAVNSRNRAEVEHLEVFAEQSGFIESVTQCLQEADKLELWRPVGIYDRSMLIGFAMYGYFPEPAPGQVWLDRLLIETDCPYMAPEPVRGTRCDSSLIRYVGEYIAQLRGISAEEVFRTTAENARRVYGL